MVSQNGLVHRVERLEAIVPATGSGTCAAQPAIRVNVEPRPCPECGADPWLFSIDIDAASGRDGDTA